MKLLTLTGPSCSGKTTLLNKLVSEHNFFGVTSHTTRPIRKGEIEGKDYYFVDEDEFESLSSGDRLLEEVSFNGFRYGVSLGEVLRAEASNKMPVLIVEPNGLKQIAKYCNRKNIIRYSAYVNGKLPVLITRYLQRSNFDDLSNKDIAERHSRRIISLFEECSTWWKEIGDRCLIQISDFNEETEEKYILDIKNLVGVK